MVTNSVAPVQSNIIRSPQQAANVFTQNYGFPKQRNVFIIRFYTNGLNLNLGDLTFAAKSIERPKVNSKVEELNQYNKKRQIITGYKLEPLRVQFYDSADCIAQQMWQIYDKYYFGDLNNQTQAGGTNGLGNQSYQYDATLNQFSDQQGTGFGFTAFNGGQSAPDAQFFFDRIEIYHFYDSVYDLYYLIHPRFQSFELDELDYASSEISMVTASIVYENLQYFSQQPVNNTTFEEFQDPSKFNGNPLPVTSIPFPNSTDPLVLDTKSFGVSVAALLASRRAGGTTVASGFRYSSDTTGNSISSFGQFQFGVTSSMGIDNSLSTMTLGNPTLTTALTLGTNTSPLTSSLPVLTAAAKSAYSGLNGATIDAIRPQISNVSTGYGTASATLTKSLLAAQAINSSKISKAPVNTDGKIINSSGRVILPAESYGVINATQTGTAQFGFNTNTSPDGFLGPCGTQLPPPYLSNAPYGIDVGRFVPAPSNVPLE